MHYFPIILLHFTILAHEIICIFCTCRVEILCNSRHLYANTTTEMGKRCKSGFCRVLFVTFIGEVVVKHYQHIPCPPALPRENRNTPVTLLETNLNSLSPHFSFSQQALGPQSERRRPCWGAFLKQRAFHSSGEFYHIHTIYNCFCDFSFFTQRIFKSLTNPVSSVANIEHKYSVLWCFKRN